MQITRRSDFSEETEYTIKGLPLLIEWTNIHDYNGDGCLPHWHEDVEFILTKEGHFTYAINEERMELAAGEGVFVNSGQLHWNQAIGDDVCRYTCVRFSPVVLCANHYITQTCVTPLLNNSSLPYRKFTEDGGIGSEVLAVLRRIAELRWAQDGSKNMELVGLLYALWDRLTHVEGALTGASEGRNENLLVLQSMIAYMNEHFEQKLKLQDICDAGAMGKTNCCQMFQRYTGRSPMEYLQALRLEKSEHFLVDTDMTVTEIAYETGFTGASYFTEVFRRQYGCTPTEFRKKHTDADGTIERRAI